MSLLVVPPCRCLAFTAAATSGRLCGENSTKHIQSFFVILCDISVRVHAKHFWIRDKRESVGGINVRVFVAVWRTLVDTTIWEWISIFNYQVRAQRFFQDCVQTAAIRKLIFGACVCMCVCVYIYIYTYMCMCTCVCKSVYVFVLMYCVCVCVVGMCVCCVCVVCIVCVRVYMY